MSPNLTQNTANIVAKLWNLCNLLKDDGVTYTDYVKELTYLLFIKMAKETDTDSAICEKYRWDKLEAKAEVELLPFYRRMLVDLGDSDTTPDLLVRSIFANANTIIKKPATLITLIGEIEKLDWYSAKEDGMGELYEGLLEKNANEKKSGAGQYFTPRVLIDSIVELMQPKIGEVIQDPAAGTGGFLISAHQYIEQHQDLNSLDEDAWYKYCNNTFYGMEFVQDTHKLALMNLFLHDIDSDGDTHGIIYGDTMSPDANKLPRADLILSNPPFGTKKGGGLPTRDDLTFPTSNKQLCFLQHIYRRLNPGGRAAVVLPDNVLFEAGIGTDIRRDLMDKCNLHTILRLPTGIFYAAGVKTNVLFFDKPKKATQDTGNTKNVWVYDLRSNMPSFGKRTPFNRPLLQTFETCYQAKNRNKVTLEQAAQSLDDVQDAQVSREAGQPEATELPDNKENSRWRCFSREYIRDTKADSLDISWIKDKDSVDAADLLEPELLAAEAMGELTEALRELNDLMEALGAEDESGAQKTLLAEAMGLGEVDKA